MSIGGYTSPSPIVRTSPQTPFIGVNCRWLESWNREALTPTGAYTLYTTGVTGTGTASTTTTPNLLTLATSGGAGDDVDVRMSGFLLSRLVGSSASVSGTPPTSKVDIWLAFNSTGTVTATDLFVGLMFEQTAALTALPTTAKHIGAFVSNSGNWFLSSADGATQTTTDTTLAHSTSVRGLHIQWSGANTGLIEFYTSGAFTTLQASQTVTALGTAVSGNMHYLINTVGANIRNFLVRPVEMIWT